MVNKDIGKMLSVAIVVATYNGIDYIEEQLDSIRNQTFRKFFCYIFDDHSTDGTFEFIVNYIHKYNLSNWKIKSNLQNLGWRLNFINAFNSVNEDIIFPADQDDIWPLDRVEVMYDLINKKDSISVLYGKVENFYNEDQLIIHSHSKTQNEITYDFDQLSLHEFCNAVPGCALCFKRKNIMAFKKYYFSELSHDGFIMHIGRLIDGVCKINYVSVYHRVHNDSSFIKEGTNKTYTNQNIHFNEINKKTNTMMIQCLKNEKILDKDRKMKMLYKISEWIDIRQLYLKTGNVKYAIRLIKYIRYFSSFRRFLSEIYHVQNDIKLA